MGEYGLYRLALHEAGHAFGLSNAEKLSYYLERPPASDIQRISHPEIEHTVMNYTTSVDDPDCSLHPFDVMAIQALYQNVP